MPPLKRHSTWPYLGFAFTDSGEPIDCTLYDVRLVVKDKANVIRINVAIGAIGSPAKWDDEATGKGHYEWEDADVDEIGTFTYEFKFVQKSDPTIKFAIPTKSFFTYEIIEDIDIPATPATP